MSDEPEEIEDADEYEFSPPELVHDESCLLLDPDGFAETYNTTVVMLRAGCLWVLDRDTHQWRNVEDFGKPEQPPKPKLSRVQ